MIKPPDRKTICELEYFMEEGFNSVDLLIYVVVTGIADLIAYWLGISK